MTELIKAAFERTADPRAKFVSCEIWPGEGLSVTYQVEGYPHQSKLYDEFTDAHPVTGALGTRTIEQAAEEIGRQALRRDQ
jgi:hypothetical protein